MALALVDQVVKRILRSATVTSVQDLGSLRRVDLGVAGGGRVAWSPGCKVQAWMGGTTLRTFTPFGWDGTGAVSLLVHRCAGSGPATAWVDGLAAGSGVQLLGPRRSLVLDDLPAPPVLVGDETSVAVAAAFGRPVAAHLFEVSGRAEVAPALAHLGIEATLVERTPDDTHVDDLAAATVAALQASPGAPLVITGKAQTIRAVRGAVKAAGLDPTARVKAYWDPRRSGLD